MFARQGTSPPTPPNVQYHGRRPAHTSLDGMMIPVWIVIKAQRGNERNDGNDRVDCLDATACLDRKRPLDPDGLQKGRIMADHHQRTVIVEQRPFQNSH